MWKGLVAKYEDASMGECLAIGNVGIQTVSNATGVEHIGSDRHLLFMAESGTAGTVIWQGWKQPYQEWKSGEIQFLPGQTDASYKTSHPYSETMLTIPDSAIRQAIQDEASYDHLDIRFRRLDEALVGSLASSIKQIATRHPDHFTSSMVIEGITMALAVAIAMSLSTRVRQALPRRKNGLSKDRLTRVLDYIEQNIHRSIGLSELAGVAALSPFHFGRSFRATTGTSPVRYVSERRIEAAKRMMIAGEDSITSISYACGFARPSHFTTAFKEATGKPPSEFRRGLTI